MFNKMNYHLVTKVMATILWIGGIGVIPFLVVYTNEHLTTFYALIAGGFGICMIPLALQQLSQLWHSNDNQNQNTT